MPYQTIEVKKLTPHIGAEIAGVDLSRPLGNQQFQEVHDALMAHQVVFFRDQNADYTRLLSPGRALFLSGIGNESRVAGSHLLTHVGLRCRVFV
jgi:alpha-ketoglutarate-dependent taurine dioxygenase